MIQQIADKVRTVSGFDPKNDADFRTVVSKFGGTVVESNNIDHIIVNGKDDFAIDINPMAVDERKRFEMAHMLGHYFLHFRNGKITGESDLDTTVSEAEQESNYFAACLLMPEEMIAQECDLDAASIAISYHVCKEHAIIRIDFLKTLNNA